jgi:hypothetical protein
VGVQRPLRIALCSTRVPEFFQIFRQAHSFERLFELFSQPLSHGAVHGRIFDETAA